VDLDLDNERLVAGVHREVLGVPVGGATLAVNRRTWIQMIIFMSLPFLEMGTFGDACLAFLGWNKCHPYYLFWDKNHKTTQAVFNFGSFWKMFEQLKVQKICLAPFWNRREKLEEVQANVFHPFFHGDSKKEPDNFFVLLMGQ
jgi:hypothetical protein